MLTKRQKEVLTFIQKYKTKHRYSPSLEEIAKHLGLTSVSTAHFHVKKLEESGYLEKGNHQARSINVLEGEAINKSFKEKRETSFSVPAYGMANAGPATIFAEENLHGYIKVPSNLHVKRNGIFAVQAQGDSMDEANINGKSIEDGDYVLIDSNHKNYRTGDYVLSIIDNYANLKKFEKDKAGVIKLISESTNKSHKPIYISSEDDYMANGKIVAVLKK